MTTNQDAINAAYSIMEANMEPITQHQIEGALSDIYDAMAPIIAAQAKADALREVESAVDDELQDAAPSNYEEDNYEAGYIAGLTFAQDLLRARVPAIESAAE